MNEPEIRKLEDIVRECNTMEPIRLGRFHSMGFDVVPPEWAYGAFRVNFCRCEDEPPTLKVEMKYKDLMKFLKFLRKSGALLHNFIGDPSIGSMRIGVLSSELGGFKFVDDEP